MGYTSVQFLNTTRRKLEHNLQIFTVVREFRYLLERKIDNDDEIYSLQRNLQNFRIRCNSDKELITKNKNMSYIDISLENYLPKENELAFSQHYQNPISFEPIHMKK